MDNLTSVKFNNNDLSLLPGVDLYNHNFNNLPDRAINIHKIARADKSIITSSEYTQKDIQVFMDVCGGSRPDTEASLTAVKALLQAQNAPLIVKNSGEEISYTATMNSFEIEWEGATAHVVIGFIASDPIGVSENSEILAAFSTTAAQATSNMTVGGSFIAQPLISVTINSVTDGTGKLISLINNKNAQGITIEADYNDGDILEVDSSNNVVRLNGTSVDYSGIFPVFPAGVQQIKYTDNFTARSVDISVTYNARFV